MVYKIVIARYEECDANKIIAFNCISLSGMKTYFETLVPLKECINKNDNEICCLAYEKLKQKILSVMHEQETPVTIIGSEFIPPDEILGYEFNI